MNQRQNEKLIFGGILGALFLAVARVMGQTNIAPALPTGTLEDPNILSAAIHQVLNNPASLTVIPFLCVAAWLIDDLPFINSRYVAHLTVVLGGSIYWLFASTSSVPRNFPHPMAVLIVNGVLCGFIAFVVHRQAVARLIQMFGTRSGNPAFLQKQTNPEP